MRGQHFFWSWSSLRYLSTQNPFYVLSAVLVLYGLRQCAVAGGDLTGGWLLMAVICGYTLLLAGAAWLIVRFGRVWDDARMILLLLVLLFLALSVSFDKVALPNPAHGAMFLALGFAFAVIVSELVLEALGMRLSFVYRVPYYLTLAMLFGYPVFLASASLHDYNRLLAWGVYLFPVVGAAAMLTLLPAAHWGHRDTRPNGTPWSWPLYPWTLFVFLWISLVLRSYSISFAFEARAGLHPEFHWHFLAPLVLAAAAVLLEIGIATCNRWVQRVAMSLPLTIVVLALAGVGEISANAKFIPELTSVLGSPLQLAAWALVLFYGIAWLRRVPRGEAGFIAALGMCGFVDRNSLSLETLASPQMLPLWIVALLLAAAGLVQERRWKCIAGGVIALLLLTHKHESIASEFIVLHRGFYWLHAAILFGLLLALMSTDRWAKVVQRAAFVLIPLAAWFAGLAYENVFPEVTEAMQWLYLIGLVALAWGYWQLQQRAIDLTAAMLTMLTVGLAPLKRTYAVLQTTALEKSLPWVTVGLALLALGVLLSLYKGGLLRRAWPIVCRINAMLRGSPT